MNDNDELEVMDQQGNRKKITRGEYARQTLEAARQYWDNLEAMRHFTVQFLQEGFPNQSLVVAERAVELSKGQVRDLYFRAVAQAETGKLDEAAANFEEIRDDAAYPADVARATAGLGRCRARQGRPDEAESLFREAIDADPDSHGPMIEMFAFLNSLGRPQDAMEKIRAMAAKYPTAAAPHRAMAQVGLMTGNQKEIREAVHNAASRATGPEVGEVLAEASMILGQSGQPQEIIKLLEPRRADIQHPIAMMNLAQAYAENDRVDEARQLLEQLQAGAPPEFRNPIKARLDQLNQLGNG